MEKCMVNCKTALSPAMLPGLFSSPKPLALRAFQWSEPNFSLQNLMHFRFYASSMGRFLKPDNIIGNMANPQSWNLYSYVNGNPVNLNDPTGHACPALIMGSAGYPTEEDKRGAETAKKEKEHDKTEDKKDEPAEANEVLTAIATAVIQSGTLVQEFMGNPISSELVGQTISSLQETTGAYEGHEDAFSVLETLGAGSSLLDISSLVTESTAATETEMALNAKIVAAGGEASGITGGVMKSGLTGGTTVALGGVAFVSGWTIGSVIREQFIPEATNEAIEETILTATDYWHLNDFIAGLADVVKKVIP